MKNYKIIECGLYAYHGCRINIRLDLAADGINTCRSITLPADRLHVIKLFNVVGVNFENGEFLHNLKDNSIRVEDEDNLTLIYNLFSDNEYMETKLL